MSPSTTLMKLHLSIVFVDDHPLAPSAIVAQIRAQPGFRVLAASAEIEAALRQVRETRPDLVLLNLTQESDDSLTLAGALHGDSPESRVILMGLKPLHRDVAGFVRAGVSGFIMMGASFPEYLRTIRSVAAGVQVLPKELTRVLFGQLNRHGARHGLKRALEIKRLSTREREVADLIVEGSSNKEIAARLEIAVHTVKNHVHNVLAKLALNSRLEVAAYSHRESTSRLTLVPASPRPAAHR